ncbi:MAG: (Fe-S)-binding protein [Candidatus Aenigmarchaeota archaeon]|nr:(Fe-S)-binding protein [Candidatus Aenigmarchaeota archaeon]MCK5321925.1 (Fe-S)-binding protein [Candidatus Aenigmarchaeota archaeon]
MNNNETDKCTLCGMCKTNCPIYKNYLTESMGPRLKAIAEKKNLNNLTDQELSAIFINCTICSACKKECPNDVDLNISKMRSELIKRGIETDAGKEMIINIRKYGNPFGKVKKGQKFNKLYCC